MSTCFFQHHGRILGSAIPPRPKMVSWIGARRDSTHTWRPWQRKCRPWHRIRCSKSPWDALRMGREWRFSKKKWESEIKMIQVIVIRSMVAPWKPEGLGELVYRPETLTEGNFFLFALVYVPSSCPGQWPRGPSKVSASGLVCGARTRSNGPDWKASDFQRLERLGLMWRTVSEPWNLWYVDFHDLQILNGLPSCSMNQIWGLTRRPGWNQRRRAIKYRWIAE